MRFIIPDGRKKFYQWDTNQRLRCMDLPAGVEIHFATPLAEEQDALAVESYEAEGAVWVDVPDELLRCPGVLTMYVYPREGEEGHTAWETSVPILAREKPADYIYTPAELQRWEALEQRLAELEENGLPAGGADGVSPVVTVEETEHGHRVTVTDANGETSFEVTDGADGTNGTDGVSPAVYVEEIEGGHRVTIDDVNGSTSFDVMDGADGTGGSGSGVIVDATLSQEGQAADAAAVGAAFEVYGAEVLPLIQEVGTTVDQHTCDITALQEQVQQLSGAASGCDCIEEVLAETELTFAAAGESLYVWQSVDTIVPLVIGKLYFVEFGGQTYECVGTAATFGTLAGVGIGNPAFAGLNDTGEPFLLGTALNGSFSACYCSTGTGPYKLSIRATRLAGLPGMTSADEDKILQIVDGRWSVVSLADSAVATYIDSYINEALGGEY